MSRRSRPLLLCAAAVLVAAAAAACGSDQVAATGGGCPQDWPETIVVGAQQFTPVIVSQDLGVGPARFTMVLLDQDGKGNIGGPDVEVETEFFDLGRSSSEPVTGGAAEPYDVANVAPFYSQRVDLDSAGTWGARVTVKRPGAEPMCEQVRFTVLEDSRAPSIGDPAPRTTNKTVADAPGGDLAGITSDTSPDPRLYQSTVAALLDTGRPFVVAFATPRFCRTRTCGPVVDQLKSAAAEHPALDIVHVEVFDDLDSATPERYVPAVSEWDLPSEPWVFVVDGAGKIVERFEGAMSGADLEAALDTVDPT